MKATITKRNYKLGQLKCATMSVLFCFVLGQGADCTLKNVKNFQFLKQNSFFFMCLAAKALFGNVGKTKKKQQHWPSTVAVNVKNEMSEFSNCKTFFH